MDHHEAVRTPSTSSAHSEPETLSTRFKLVSPLGGEALTLDWDPDNPPTDTVAVWISIIHQCHAKFPAIMAPFHNNKDKDGNDRPVTLALPDPRKEPDPNDTTDADLTGTPKERYHKKFSLIVQVYTNAANALAKLWKGASNPDAKTWFQDRCDTALLTLICNTTFNSAVSSVKSLNSHYAPFSSEVYGETKYEQMQLIIQQLNFKENDVFLDLGSGVGHLVLYVAGATKVKKAVGIEKAEVPANYAEKMNTEYKKWMGWFKKKYRPFELMKGDFLDPKLKHYIQEATIIFINNYAFNPDLENRIKMEIINEMETGRRIVSTKPYAPVTSAKNFNPRAANQMEAILDVIELETVKQPTSWTDKKVPYYLHTVNQTKLQEYYDNKSKSQSSSLSSVDNSRRPSISSKSNSSSSSREGSQMKDVNSTVVSTPFVQSLSIPKSVKTDSHYGATTRNKWKEQINETDGRKQKRKRPLANSSNSPEPVQKKRISKTASVSRTEEQARPLQARSHAGADAPLARNVPEIIEDMSAAENDETSSSISDDIIITATITRSVLPAWDGIFDGKWKWFSNRSNPPYPGPGKGFRRYHREQ